MKIILNRKNYVDKIYHNIEELVDFGGSLTRTRAWKYIRSNHDNVIDPIPDIIVTQLLIGYK